MLAQCLSAYMGIYVQDTYAAHGASWKENLFYSHFLSLPFFLPLSSTLRRQYGRLAATPTRSQVSNSFNPLTIFDTLKKTINSAHDTLGNMDNSAMNYFNNMPIGIGALIANAITQLACISGVNLLSAQASAVTVTIVLNIRKLVSFVISTIYYGHQLSGTMILGAALVFGSGALYGWETSWRIPQQRRKVNKEEKRK